MRFVFFIIFPLVILVYLAAVFFGYEIGISKYWPSLSSFETAALASIASLLIWGLAVLVARIHVQQSGLQSRALAGTFFILLFCASGLGIANSMFFQWEGPTVLRQAVERAEKQITGLRSVSTDKLVPNEYREIRDKIYAAYSRLESEIKNPSICGVGAGAKDAINEIARFLPNFHILTGTETRSLNCSNRRLLEEIADRYKQQIDEQILATPYVLNARIREREALLAKVQSFADEERGHLAKLRGQISIMSLKAHRDSPDFANISRELEATESRYSDLRQQVSSFIRLSSADYPETFDLNNVRNVGAFTSTIDVILARIFKNEGHIANLLYIIVPLLVDVFVVLLILSILKRPQIYQVWRSRSGDDISYLLPPLRNQKSDER